MAKPSQANEQGLDAATLAINEAIYFRGLFVQRYSGIEFAVSELLTRARLLPEYSLLLDLPFTWPGKVRMLRTLLNLPGPVQSYKGVLLPPIDELRAFKVHRHMMVHGLMAARMTDAGMQIRVRSYDHVKGFGLGAAALDMFPEEFETLCERLRIVSHVVTGTIAHICREVPLPLLSAEPMIPHPSLPLTDQP